MATRRKKGLMSSRRRAARIRLSARLTNKLSNLVREGKVSTTEFKKLDSQLSRLQNASRYR